MPLKKKYPWNVLVFPASSEVGLEIKHALGDSKEVILHGAVQPGLSLAAFHFKRLHEIPPISEPACLAALKALLKEQAIDAVFPAYDDVLLWLAEHASELEAEIITSPLKTCTICRSKRATYETLKDTVPVPRLYAPSDRAMPFPVFVKPDKGQGSQRARRIDTSDGLKNALAAEPDLIVMENLPGREYTVDCFSQRGHGVLYAKARIRYRTKAGVATLTQPENVPFAHPWAERIHAALDLRGAWFFQAKENAKGEPCLLEVAPRLAGSSAQSRVSGPNFPLLSLYEAAGHAISIDAFESAMPMGRSLATHFLYDKPLDALYLDLDHTLILREEVNPHLAALIFQCRNRKIPVVLLTRHKGDLNATLKRYRLDGLFDRIHHILNDAQLKADFIKEKNAVFIDDSYVERRDVAARRGIRCFDIAAAACLLDERA